MSAPPAPTWKLEKCTSAYEWETAPPPPTPFTHGKQAAKISLVRKRKYRAQVYVCKWYSTSGVKPTSVGGSKFIYREWQILSRIRHPNVVTYEDFCFDPNGPGLARLYLEFCPERDLVYCLKGTSQDGYLRDYEALQVLEQLTQALLYIHHGVSLVGDSLQLAAASPLDSQTSPDDLQAGWATILHRDIKPTNVFVTSRDKGSIRVKLGDFGIAKFETDGTDTYVGSREFLAPEQRTANRDGRKTTIRSDIYALGVTMKLVTNLGTGSAGEHIQRHLPTGSWDALRSLLDRLTCEDVYGRPESAVIIDEIRATLRTPRRSTTMLGEVAQSILDWDTQGLTSRGRKKSKADLESQFQLCRRLLLASKGAPEFQSERNAILDRAVRFINVILEALDDLSENDSLCPSWKGSIVENLVSSLRQHGVAGATLNGLAKPTTGSYDIGQHDYKSLREAASMKRREMIFDVVKERFPSLCERLSRTAESHFLKSATWSLLLSFTSSVDNPASPALHVPLGRQESELRRSDRDDNIIRAQLPGRLPLAPYLDKLPLEITNEERTAKPILGTNSATSHPLNTLRGDVPSSEKPIENQPTVTGPPSSSAVLAMGKCRKPPTTSSLAQSPMLRNTDDASKQSAKTENLRLRAAQEQKRSQQEKAIDLEELKKFGKSLAQSPMLRNTDDASKQSAKTEKLGLSAAQERKRSLQEKEKAVKLEDLKKFGKHFKLKSRIPDDLVPILANDPQKQLAIRRKNEDSARVNAQKSNDKKQSKTPTPTAAESNLHDHLYQQFLQAQRDSLRSQLSAQQQQQQQQRYQPNYPGGFYYDPITARPQFGNLLERTVQNSLPQTNSSQAMHQLPQQMPMPPSLLGAYRGEPTRQYINAYIPGLNGPVSSFNGHQAANGDYWRNPLHQCYNSIGSSSYQRLPSAPPTGTIPPTQVASNSADKRSHSFEFPQAEQSQKSVPPLAHEAALLQGKDTELSQAHHTGRVAPASWAEMARGKQS